MAKAVGKPSGIRAGSVYIELGVYDKFTAALNAAQKQLTQYGQTIAKVGTAVAGIGSSIVAGFAATSVAFAKTSSQLADMSARTSVGVEALQELGFAGGQVGVELEQIELALRAQARTLKAAADGSEEAATAYTELGLSAAKLQAVSPEEAFVLIGDALSKMENESIRAALALKLLGRSGTTVLPLFQQGAKGLEEMRQKAKSFALVLGKDAVEAGDKLDDTLALMNSTLRSLSNNIGAAVAPVFTDLAQKTADVVAAATRWVRQNPALAVGALKVGAAVAVAGGAIAALGFGLIGIGATIAATTTVLAALGAALAFAFSPIGLTVVAALGAATVAAVAFQDKLIGLWETLKEGAAVVGEAFDALAAGDLAGAADIAFAGVEVAWSEAILRMETVWFRFRDLISNTFDDVTTRIAKGITTLLSAPAGQKSAITGDALGLLGGDLGEKLNAIELGRGSTDSQSANELEASKNRVRAARDALAAARLASEAARFGPPSSLAGGGRRRGGDTDPFSASTAAVAQRIRDLDSRGTFNAAAARGLNQPGNRTELEIARSTAQTARHTKKMADAVDAGGLAFE